MDDFTRAAIVGLSSSASVPAAEPALESLTPRDVGRERAFLLSAAVRSTYRSAGHAPSQRDEIAKEAPVEVWREISPGASEILRDALQSNDHQLIAEFANSMTARQMRARFALLPALLGIRDEQTRVAITPILGERGRWLSPLRSDWKWLLDGSAPTTEQLLHDQWNEGAVSERSRALRLTRNSNPTVAREWLSAVWKQESAENRARFLELFASNIDASDEEFLDAALSDRSLGVRAVAASLLARIPASRFAQRCLARATESITFEAKAPIGFAASVLKVISGKETPSIKLVCEPPAADDPIAKELAVGKAPQGVGARAHVLTQLLSLVDVRVWEEKSGATPTQILRSAADTDWMAPLVDGFARAALQLERRDWLLPLLHFASGSDEVSRQEWVSVAASQLPPKDAEGLVLSLLDGQHARLNIHLSAVVSSLPSIWGTSFSRAVIAALRRMVAAGGDSEPVVSWISLLPSVAHAIDPAVFDDVLHDWTFGESWYGPSRARQIEQLIHVVKLRNDFLEEMNRE